MARQRRFKQFFKKATQTVGNYARFTADNLTGAVGFDDAITEKDYKGANAQKWSNASDKVGKRVVQVAGVVLTAGAAGVTLGGVAAVAPKLVKLGSKGLAKLPKKGTGVYGGGLDALLNKGQSSIDSLVNNGSSGVSGLSGNGNGNFWDKVLDFGKKFVKDGVEGARNNEGTSTGNNNDSNNFDFMEFFKINGQKILMVGVLPLVGLTVLYKSLKR